jgi:hypothetical protein
MTNITPAAIRLFARALEIQDAIDDLDNAELIARSEHLLRRSAKYLEDSRAGRDIEYEEDEEDNRALYLADPEYQTIKTALGKELRLAPGELNPLDLEFGQEWEGNNDRRLHAWLRAYALLQRLYDAHFELILGFPMPGKPASELYSEIANQH